MRRVSLLLRGRDSLRQILRDIVALGQLGRRYPGLVGRVGGGAGLEQVAHHVDAVVLTREVERGRVEKVALVHVAPFLQEQLHRRKVSRAGGW